jgi:NACHT domain
MDTIHSDHQVIKDNTSLILKDISALRMGVDAIQQGQSRQQLHDILEWISSTDFPAQQSDFIARRQDGTGLWFLHSPEFSEWIHGSNRTLFCPGIPGAGKTIMAATTIDYLLRTLQSDAIGVAYIYCSYKGKSDQNTTSLLAAILKQLVQAQPSIAEPVTRLYDDHANRTRPLLEEILSALQSILTNYSSVYIVVDALDECQEMDGTRSQLLAKLRDLQCKADMRLMVTSRFIPDIENEFKLALRLEVRASDADVKQFVMGQMFRLPKCVQRDKELQRVVQDKIVEAVDGMSAFRTPLTSTVSLRLCQVSSYPSPCRFASR